MRKKETTSDTHSKTKLDYYRVDSSKYTERYILDFAAIHSKKYLLIAD